MDVKCPGCLQAATTGVAMVLPLRVFWKAGTFLQCFFFFFLGVCRCFLIFLAWFCELLVIFDTKIGRQALGNIRKSISDLRWRSRRVFLLFQMSLRLRDFWVCLQTHPNQGKAF